MKPVICLSTTGLCCLISRDLGNTMSVYCLKWVAQSHVQADFPLLNHFSWRSFSETLLFQLLQTFFESCSSAKNIRYVRIHTGNLVEFIQISYVRTWKLSYFLLNVFFFILKVSSIKSYTGSKDSTIFSKASFFTVYDTRLFDFH